MLKARLVTWQNNWVRAEMSSELRLRENLLCRDDIEEVAYAIFIGFMGRFIGLLRRRQQNAAAACCWRSAVRKLE